MPEGNFIPRNPANFTRTSVNMEEVEPPFRHHHAEILDVASGWHVSRRKKIPLWKVVVLSRFVKPTAGPDSKPLREEIGFFLAPSHIFFS